MSRLILPWWLNPVMRPMLWSPGGYPCCCSGDSGPDPDYRCELCIEDTVPESMTVTISGMGEGTCGTCYSLNDIYTLDYEPDVLPCFYRLIDYSMDCTCSHIRLQLADDGHGNVAIGVQFRNAYGFDLHTWIKIFTDEPIVDCSAFSSVDIPWDNDGLYSECDGSASTCTVTSG